MSRLISGHKPEEAMLIVRAFSISEISRDFCWIFND